MKTVKLISRQTSPGEGDDPDSIRIELEVDGKLPGPLSDMEGGMSYGGPSGFPDNVVTALSILLNEAGYTPPSDHVSSIVIDRSYGAPGEYPSSELTVDYLADNRGAEGTEYMPAETEVGAGTPVADVEKAYFWLMAVTDPYGAADEVTVTAREDEEKYVCDFPSNADYPADDPVVDCIPPHHLRLDQLAGEQTPETYTYPVSRLEPIEVAVVERTAEATIKPPVVVEGLGECGACGAAITEEADRYIEDDGGAYCDISCYNEALTS